MNSWRKVLFTIPVNILNWVYKLQIIIWGGLAFSFIFLYGALYKVNDKRYITDWYPFAGVVIIAIIIAGFVRGKYKNLPIAGYALSLIISCYSSFRFISFTELVVHVTKYERLAAFASCIYILFFAINSLLALVYKKAFDYNIDSKKLKYAAIVSFTISFICFYYLPAESFFSSFSDYAFPYQILAKAFISNIIFWSVIPAIVISMLKDRLFKIVYSGLIGLMAAIYIQYLFFNRYMGSINGVGYNWKEQAAFSIVNIIIWIALISGLIILAGRKEKAITAYSFISVYVLLIHLVTYGTVLIKADADCFKFSATYFSFADQFKVAKEDNTIIFIFDAADNVFLKELYDNRDESLEKFNDFTMYTNTCSVYDYTSLSMLQMITNFDFDNTKNNVERRNAAWNSERTNAFFSRLHNNGYLVNVYNFDNENTSNIIGKIDNAVEFNPETDKVQYIGYKKIRKAVSNITAYTITPCLMKQFVDMKETSFAKAIVYRNQNLLYANSDFMDNLELSFADNDKSVIYQHVAGCHPPDDNVETMKYCLEIADEYLNQMKELGVYDNATIIITADHGIVDPSEYSGKDMQAATPILLVKKAGESHESLVTNMAPVYHEDLMATILLSAGLYDSNTEDISLFGRTFFDIDENENRERIWYDRVNDPDYDSVGVYNTYYGYKYTGDTSELERVVEMGDNLDIYPVPVHND